MKQQHHWRETLARRGSAAFYKELECRIDGPCRVPDGVMTVHGDLTWYFYARTSHRSLPVVVQCEHAPGHKPERGVWAHNEEEARAALQLLDVVTPQEEWTRSFRLHLF